MIFARTKRGRVGLALALVALAVSAWVLLQAWQTQRRARALQAQSQQLHDDLLQMCQAVKLHMCDMPAKMNDDSFAKWQCVQHLSPIYRVCVADQTDILASRYSAFFVSRYGVELQKSDPAAFWKQDAALLDAMQAKLDAALAAMAAALH